MIKVCVVTGNRSEFGLLLPILQKMQNDKSINLKVIVTGSHLQKKFGNTKDEIFKSGIKIHKKIHIFPSKDDAQSILKSISKSLNKFITLFNTSYVDILLVIGDRHEIMAPVIAAIFYKIPVAHISGGDCTLGAMDDTIRNAITKMSWLHFVSNSDSRKRVIQMGENPKRVYNVGNLGTERIKNIQTVSRGQLSKNFNIIFLKKNILVTFHPVTYDLNSSSEHFREILEALKTIKNTAIIFTYPNNDIDGSVIIKMIKNFVQSHKNCHVFKSLGFVNYISLLRQVDCVVGNSSSGLLEAPSLKIATINIGDRQEGRLKAKSIIDCQPKKNKILLAIKKSYSINFQKSLKKCKNPYSNFNTSQKIYTKIKNFKKPTNLKKLFFNL